MDGATKDGSELTWCNYIGAVHKRRRQLGGVEESKNGQNCRWILLKNCRHGEGGVENS